jgi:hypothetical protein
MPKKIFIQARFGIEGVLVMTVCMDLKEGQYRRAGKKDFWKAGSVLWVPPTKHYLGERDLKLKVSHAVVTDAGMLLCCDKNVALETGCLELVVDIYSRYGFEMSHMY